MTRKSQTLSKIISCVRPKIKYSPEVSSNNNNNIFRKQGVNFNVDVNVSVNFNKQLLDEVEHDIMNYQNRGPCYLPKPKAEADNTDTRF